MAGVSTAARGCLTLGRTLALLGVTATLAGCLSDQRVVEYDYPSDTRQRHPIAIREGDRTFEVFIGTNRGSLTPVQREELLAFARIWRSEATGGIVVDVPTGTPNEHAAASALREVRAILAEAGIPPRAVALRPYRPADPIKLATIRVSYPKMIAEAGPCGLWPQDIGASLGSGSEGNRPYWNFGCANQRNIAAMVENPADLVQPRAETPPSAPRRETVLEKYRKGESTATTYGDANKGKISEIGQ